MLTAAAAGHENSIGLSSESLAVPLDEGICFRALSGMRMHRAAAPLIGRDTDTETLPGQQRNDRFECRCVDMPADATCKQLNLAAWLRECRIEAIPETEGLLLRNQCKKF